MIIGCLPELVLFPHFMNIYKTAASFAAPSYTLVLH